MHVIGTAGHVDHGKSTLVHRLTGIDPDRLEEEKRRGLTIDLGFAWLRLPSGNEIGIVDVPGHERFIKNMLAGAGGISVCLFVVAATEGWMPQSAEHLTILDVLGVHSGVVALTKVDAVDVETVELAIAELREKLEPTSLAGAAVVPCSGITGEGLDRLVAALDAAVASAARPTNAGRPRLWVDRVFTIAGAGTVVTGTLAGGAFAVGDDVELAGPGDERKGRRARIRTIQSHRKEVALIEPGNRTALNLAGLERQGAERGDAVVKQGQWRQTDRIDAVVRVLPASITGHQFELTEKGAHILYIGSAETPVRIKLLGRDAIAAGDSGFAQIFLRDALPIGPRDRFVLRDAGRVVTFGGGEVLDPLAPIARRGDPARLELLARLSHAGPDLALGELVRAYDEIEIAEALFRSGARSRPDGVVPLGPIFVSRSRFEGLIEATRAALRDYHAQHPLERGMPREALRAAIAVSPNAFDALLDALDDVLHEAGAVRLGSFRVQLAPEHERVRSQVLAKIESAGFTPPLGKELGADADLLRALVDAGELVKIGDFYLTGGQARAARAKVRERIASAGPITVADIRDLLGTSRKYAVPLCEWLDETGATVRQGDVRRLGPTP